MSTQITKEFAYKNVLEVLKEIAEQAEEAGTWLGFDVVRITPATFEFRTYTGQRGQDHCRTSSDPRLVGKQYGNLTEASFGTFHSEERNFIYVGGQGEGADRTIVTRSNEDRISASKWNRRELFVDAHDLESLEAEGDAALGENKPKQSVTGTLRDTPGMMFGIHYGFGDMLTAQVFDFHIDCRVSSVRVEVSQDAGEQIDVRLQGEL